MIGFDEASPLTNAEERKLFRNKPEIPQLALVKYTDKAGKVSFMAIAGMMDRLQNLTMIYLPVKSINENSILVDLALCTVEAITRQPDPIEVGLQVEYNNAMHEYDRLRAQVPINFAALWTARLKMLELENRANAAGVPLDLRGSPK